MCMRMASLYDKKKHNFYSTVLGGQQFSIKIFEYFNDPIQKDRLERWFFAFFE
jgi:hypothetical protein